MLAFIMYTISAFPETQKDKIMNKFIHPFHFKCNYIEAKRKYSKCPFACMIKDY